MQITQEDLKSLYMRAEQYLITKGEGKPNELEITNEGGLLGVYIECRYGGCDESTIEIPLSELTRDLEEIAQERKIREEQERIESLKREKEAQERRIKEKIQEELKLYEQLKAKYEKK